MDNPNSVVLFVRMYKCVHNDIAGDEWAFSQIYSNFVLMSD